MKYLGLLMALILASCQSTTPSTTINADIDNIKAKEISFSGIDFKKQLTVTDGKVSDTLNIAESGLYEVSFARNKSTIYLTPGDQITLNADASDYRNTLIITSPHTAIQNYLNAKKNIERTILNRAAFDMEPADFIASVTTATDSLSTIIDGSGTDEAFMAFEKKNLSYDVAKYKTVYTKYSDNADATDAQFTHSITLDDENEYIKSPNYKDLVSTSFSVNIMQDTSKTYEENFMANISTLNPGNIKNQLLYGDMRYLMGPNEKLEKMYTFFKKNSTNPENNEKMSEKYSELIKLAAGEISPTFDYENFAGGNTKLSDLIGKYVYVDVWATWCGPCIGEIPSLKKVEKAYHDKNIEFVSISVDAMKDHEKWGEMIGEKELGGIQLFSDDSWKSKFVQDYKINSIPRFILIDPEGKIVSADAPRPSDDKLIEKFKALVI